MHTAYSQECNGIWFNHKSFKNSINKPSAFNCPVPASTTATIDINLINILRDGPEVSLNGSPIVSPITAAS